MTPVGAPSSPAGRSTLLGLAVLALALGALGCPDDTPAPPPPPPVALADLALVEGQVTLERGDAGVRGARQEPLFDGDLLRTQEQSRAVIRFKNGRELELGESAKFRLRRGGQQVALDLEEGLLGLVGADGLQVVGPYGTADLGAQSRAKLGGGDGLTFELLAGDIVLTEPDGGTRTLKGGDSLRFTMGAIELTEAPDAGAPSAPTPLEVQLTAERGPVELQPGGTGRFRRAGAQAVSLTRGSAFKVGAAGRARLDAPGLTAALSGGTAGALESAQDEGGEGQVALALKSGGTQLQLQGTRTSQVTFTGTPAPARVRNVGEATVAVQRLPRAYRVQVLAGEVELLSAQGARKVQAGEVAQVDAKGTEVSGARRPALVVPLGRKVRVFTRGPQDVGLALPEATGRVEVAADAEFSRKLVSGAAKDFVALQAPLGELYWRAVGADGAPLARGYVRFLTDTGGSSGRPEGTDTVDDNRPNTTVVYQESLPSLTFSFAPAPGAAQYRVLVYRAGELQKPVVERTVKENKCLVEAGALTDGSYVWKAVALTAAGAELPGGRYNKMDVVYDNSHNALAIQRPLPNEKAGPDTVASGVAPEGSKLFLNGKPVALDPKGRFSVPVGRVDTLVFRSVRADGSEDYWVRKLR